MHDIDVFMKKLSHEYHKKQFRKDGITPYTKHTDYVGDHAFKFYKGFLERKEIEPISKAVGYGHDLLEDTDLTVNELLELGIKAGFNAEHFELRIVNPIVRLTRLDKEYPVIGYLNNIKGCLVATAVKLADLEHNLSDLSAGNLRDKYQLCQNYLIGE